MRLIKDVKKYHHYLIYSTKAQLKSEVTNSYLDWVWWLLEPLCHMIIYSIIYGYVFKASEEYFTIFIFIGITFWGFFNRTVNGSVRLLKESSGIITKVYIPKHIILIKRMMVNGFKMFIQLIVVVVMLVIQQVPVNAYILYIIPSIIILFLFTFAVGCFLMHFGIYVDDLSYIVSICLNMLMYFTGTFYSLEKRLPSPIGGLLTYCNPIAMVIAVTRNGLLYRLESPKLPMVLWLFISLIMSCLGARLVYKNENSYAKML